MKTLIKALLVVTFPLWLLPVTAGALLWVIGKTLWEGVSDIVDPVWSEKEK